MESKFSVVTPPLHDKSLWLSVLVPLFLALAKIFKLNISDELISQVLDVVLAFILSSKGASVAKAFAVAKMESDKAKASKVPTVLEVGNGK